MVKRKDSDALNSYTETPVKRRRVSNPSPPDSVQSQSAHTPRVYCAQGTQTVQELSPLDSGEHKSRNIIHKQPSVSSEDHILEWAEQLPPYEHMSNKSLKRHRSSNASSSPSWDRIRNCDIYTELAEYGIVKGSKPLKQDCKYLEGNLIPGSCMIHRLETLDEVIARAGAKNEGYIQRTILPWTVPSLSDLDSSGEWDTDYSKFDDDVFSTWTGIELMGSTHPKPDYLAGLSENAFDLDERNELKLFDKPSTPMRCGSVLMPFLICEAKSGWTGISKAEQQNLHAGGILMRSLFELYKTAELEFPYEEILIWTIDMNNAKVLIFGHYARLEDGAIQYCRTLVKEVSLWKEHERFIPYNFVRNVYQSFVPEHIARIKKVIVQIRQNRLAIEQEELAARVSESPLTRQEYQTMKDKVRLYEQNLGKRGR